MGTGRVDFQKECVRDPDDMCAIERGLHSFGN